MCLGGAGEEKMDNCVQMSAGVEGDEAQDNADQNVLLVIEGCYAKAVIREEESARGKESVR